MSNRNVKKQDIVVPGKYGVDCVELGGPEPGIGCAGRGIIKGIDIIKELGIIDRQSYDLILFDILGDVVCGGFFEPIRSGGSDEMYIVTSGEFNSLFAANNLCKGFVNNASQYRNVKLKGLIGNCRGVKNEERILKEFAQKVGLPLIACIGRDERIEACSEKNLPLYDVYSGTDITETFDSLYEIISSDSAYEYDITPLDFVDLRKTFSKSYNAC